MKSYSEPFKSCSLFGTLRYFSGIKNTVCLIHGPHGCAFFARNSVYDLNGYNSCVKFKPKIFTTGMDEDDAIFGGQVKITNAINEIIEDLNPECIFVFNCCLSELTGESIDTISEEIGSDSACKIISVHSAGFKGDHTYGYRLACDIFFENFCRIEVLKEKNTVNILGEFNVNHLATLELRDYLTRAGIKVISTIPTICTIEELKHSPEAELNIVYCGNASMRMAKHFEREYGTPYVGSWGEYFGIKEVKKLYDDIFDYFHVDKTIYREDYIKLNEKIDVSHNKFVGKRAFIIAGMRRSLGYARLFKELGINVTFLYSEISDDLDVRKQFSECAERVVYNTRPDNIREMIEEEKPDFILTTLNELVAPHKFVSIIPGDYNGFIGMMNFIDVLLDVVKNKDSIYLETL